MKINEFLEKLNEADVVAALKKQGKAKNKPDSDFCPIELEIGTEVEYEHVKDKDASKEIAKDHLEENPHYYTKVLGPAEKEVMEKAEKIVKKHGYKSVEDYLSKSKIKVQEAMCKKEDVIDFLKKNPQPSDQELHDWAESKGFTVSRVEEIVYELASNYVEQLR